MNKKTLKKVKAETKSDTETENVSNKASIGSLEVDENLKQPV